MLESPVTVNTEGGPRKISSQAAALLRLREKALKGDAKALQMMLELAQQHGIEEGTAAARGVQGVDAEILRAYVDRNQPQAAIAEPPARLEAETEHDVPGA